MTALNSIDQNLIGITGISVKGFKSISEERSIKIRPLTVLAGANNSGKSSIMHPILMMKQTMEEISDDRGDLIIDGKHVEYSNAIEFLSRLIDAGNDQFIIKIELDGKQSIIETFQKFDEKPIQLIETIYESENGQVILKSDMTEKEILARYPFYDVYVKSLSEGLIDYIKKENIQKELKDITLKDLGIGLCIRKKRCLLGVAIDKFDMANEAIFEPVFLPLPTGTKPFPGRENQQKFENYVLDIVHVPADRGSPSRSYKIATVGSRFKGPITDYMASIIFNWKTTNSGELELLGKWLDIIGLTWKIDVSPISDNRVKILVPLLREPSGERSTDMINIMDVGFGISQILPVLTALLVAKKNQLVYIEQPEVHLHPNAQYRLAICIAEAMKRGIHIILETHSELLLLGIQTLVAKKMIYPDDVVLHWFTRENGVTIVNSGNMDEIGAYGDWPVDFSDVSLLATKEYLKATGFKTGK